MAVEMCRKPMGAGRRALRRLRRLALGVSFAAVLAASPVLAQSNQWTGAVDSDFGKGGNFSAGVPTGNVVVDFRANQPTVTGTSSVGSLTVQGTGTTFGIDKGATLNADGITTRYGTSLSTAGGTINTKGPIQAEGRVNLLYGATVNGGINAKSGGAVSVRESTVNNGVTVDAGGSYTSLAAALNGGLTNAGRATLRTTSLTGHVVNQGSGEMNLEGTPFKDGGSLTNRDTGLLTLVGNVDGVSNFTNTGGGKTSISGNATLEAKTVYNGAGAVLENNGKLVSATWITNIGILQNAYSGAQIVGGLDNSGTVDNKGTISGGVKNSGLLSNVDTGVINGGLTNTGKATNAGTLNGGVVNAATGELAIAATGIVNGGIVNSGKVSNLGVVNDIVTNKDGTFTNEGKLAGGVTLTGGELLSNKTTSVIAGGLTNSAKATLAGTMTGAVTNNAGAQIVIAGDTHGDGKLTNAAGATLALTGGSLDGFGVVTNEGLVTVSGTRTFGTAGFVNGATGTLSMQNGAAGDKLTIDGPYTGTAGSLIGIDIDTRTTAKAPSDVLVINGKATGISALTLAFAPGGAGLLTKPIEVIKLGTGSTLALNTGRVSSQPYVNYYLTESAAGSGVYQLTSQFDPSLLTNVASALSAGLTSYQAALSQPIRPMVSRPVRCEANQITTSPFLRAMGGEDRISATQTADGAGTSVSSPTQTTNKVSGFQAGLDFGVCNIGGGGWDMNLGVSGGQVGISGSTSTDMAGAGGGAAARTTTASSMSVPFFGAHALFSAGGFNLELGIRHEQLDASLNSRGEGGGYLVNTTVKGQGWSFNGLASYRFILPYAFFIEPHVGLSSGSIGLSNVAMGTGAGDTLNLGRASTGMVRGGVNIGTAFRPGASLIVSPFAHFSLWSQLGGGVSGQATLASIGETVAVKSQGGGSFAQVGGGLMLRSTGGGVSAFVRADARFGDAVQGYGVNGGLRLTF